MLNNTIVEFNEEPMSLNMLAGYAFFMLFSFCIIKYCCTETTNKKKTNITDEQLMSSIDTQTECLTSHFKTTHSQTDKLPKNDASTQTDTNTEPIINLIDVDMDDSEPSKKTIEDLNVDQNYFAPKKRYFARH